jgi:dephospho-CoA kinase
MAERTFLDLIVCFVGLGGTGKTTAVQYLCGHGYPKVTVVPSHDPAQAISEIESLIQAGQHRIVVDGAFGADHYLALKKAFPGELKTIALLAPEHIRHRRLEQRAKDPLTKVDALKKDWEDVESHQRAIPVALANHFILNEGNLEQFYDDIRSTLKECGFIR